MKIPPEITYRNVEKTNAIDALINEKITKLEQVCNYLSSCHIVIEKVHDRPRSGSPHRVRIDMTIPPGHELVAESNPPDVNQYPPLEAVIRDAFQAAIRQLRDLTEQQRESDKAKTNDSAEQTTALVTKLFSQQGYGFIKTLDGEEVYFHRNSVLHDEFDRLEIGTGVHCFVELGEEGPQASTVKIVDKPGVSAGKAGQTIVEPPLGWQQ
ncbi:MAG: HPF/RaiA family ribosome-associated protein [Pelatocladus maniniholoensis HA4357-MV3]|jgi:cold shock CspA family protein|uniref:HPF/RaiA family ribosome-associated protein n=1 Tax=Pelatocladus maniniholoensis HA4357-MV3 TaxID=1117104 RepID=A0A9E3H9K7_9NOST|nr:HPF/RaiA family ribosome-associated protein [Pelatocladus maniniholoensis HA4357-MV3]BAZ68882.1 cold-shock DNA-binding domain protein [Fischerella sp. NIES-4106]